MQEQIEDGAIILMHDEYDTSVEAALQVVDELKNQGYSDIVLESILYHHENYDGSGYPSNKAGDDIPIGARILRVCDVYAALISDRPYRRGFDISSVMELMIDEVKNFDMQVFLAFQRVVHNGDGQNFYKRGGQHGIKEETGNRYEGYFTKRDGNQELCDEHDS